MYQQPTSPASPTERTRTAAPTRRQRVRRWLSIAAVVSTAVLGASATANATSEPTWSVGVPSTFATGVESAPPRSGLSAVSCTSAGNCTAVGFFKDVDGNIQAFTQTATDGVWADGVPATFAADVQNAAPNAEFNSVSCVSSGNCTAVGSFMDFVGNRQAFTQTSANGVWADAVPVTFGADVQNAYSPNSEFKSVSCPSSGNCTAVGSFRDPDGNYQAFTQTSTSGAWADGVPATFAADVQSVAPNAYFNSVSCVSSGNCTAAGYFTDQAGGIQAFTQTSTNGVWADGVPATFAADVQNVAPNAYFSSVSCASAGNCTAAGNFTDTDGNRQAFTQTSVNGVWADAVPATFAPDVQNSTPDAKFNSVSCASAGNCTAAGYFKGQVGSRLAFTQTSVNGVWADAVLATFAPDVQSAAPYAYFTSVSCASVGNCTAAGGFEDVDGNYQAFTQTSVNGVWADAVPATFAPDVQNSTPDAGFSAVSCAPAGNCTAVGTFADTEYNYVAFTQSSTAEATPPPPPPPPLPVTGQSFPLWPAAILVAAGAVLVLTSASRRRIID